MKRKTVWRIVSYFGKSVVVLAALGVAVLWWISYRHDECTGYATTHGAVLSSWTFPGTVSVSWEDTSGDKKPQPAGWARPFRPLLKQVDFIIALPPEPLVRRMFSRGFKWIGFSLSYSVRAVPLVSTAELSGLFGAWDSFELQVPMWFLEVLLVLPLTWWSIKFVRQRRGANRKGLCATCGYDLRATPERCPECGHAVTLSLGPR